MDINQIALLLDHEIEKIDLDLSFIGKAIKDQTALNPDPQLLSKLHLKIGQVANTLTPRAEQLVLAALPKYAEFLPAMKGMYLAEMDRANKEIADAIAKKQIPAEESK